MPTAKRPRARKDPFSTRFRKALADLESKGISQAEVAADLGYSENTITSWKRGHHQPRLKSLKAIAKALEIPLEEFLTEKAPPSAKGNPSPEKLVDDLARLDLLEALETLAEQKPSLQHLARSSNDLIALLRAAQRAAGG
jgi:transcriptional regulator with XRE-family HTH domain